MALLRTPRKNQVEDLDFTVFSQQLFVKVWFYE